MQTIPSRSATLPYKHRASRPCWLAATPTHFALPQTSAAAAPPATPGGGVATRPIACVRPPPLRHPPPSLDAEAARMATGKNGGRQGRRRGGSPPPAACSSATVHGTAALSPACAPARGARPTRPLGPNGRHALMTTTTRRNPPPPPSLPRTPPRHASPPRRSPPSPPPAVRSLPPAPRQHSQRRNTAADLPSAVGHGGGKCQRRPRAGAARSGCLWWPHPRQRWPPRPSLRRLR